MGGRVIAGAELGDPLLRTQEIAHLVSLSHIYLNPGSHFSPQVTAPLEEGSLPQVIKTQ